MLRRDEEIWGYLYAPFNLSEDSAISPRRLNGYIYTVTQNKVKFAWTQNLDHLSKALLIISVKSSK